MGRTTRVIRVLRIGFPLLGILFLWEAVLKGAETAGPTPEGAFAQQASSPTPFTTGARAALGAV